MPTFDHHLFADVFTKEEVLPEFSAQGITTDTRDDLNGKVFVALKGDRFDGHTFVAKAFEKGAVCCVVDHSYEGEGALVRVPDTRRFLGDLARVVRERNQIPVVAVAGSNGKTTTKDILAHLLSNRFETVSSVASFNNDIGLPLTLFGLKESTEAAVVELGTNHPGEISRLATIARPTMGVITSIGREHLEFFHDLEGVADEEGGLAESLDDDGMLFINSDTPYAEAIANRTEAMVVRVGSGLTADWVVSGIRMDGKGVTFRLSVPAEPQYAGEYAIELPGKHNAYNAALAIAVAASLGVSPECVRESLSTVSGPSMRMDVRNVGGLTLINDAYNANADSTLAAIETLRGMKCDGHRIAVIGQMAELGDQTDAAHAEIGARAAGLGLDCVITLGEGGRVTAEACLKCGMQQVYHFEMKEDVCKRLQELVHEGDCVLFKASRSAKLEDVFEELVKFGDHQNSMRGVA